MNNTFLDKIETTFTELKESLLKEFGEHMSIHNLMSDAKRKVLSHAAEHFGEEVSSEEGKSAPAQDAPPSTQSSSQESSNV